MREYLVAVPSEDAVVGLLESEEIRVKVESQTEFFRAGYRYCLDIITGYYLGGASAITLVDCIVHESLEMEAIKEMKAMKMPECDVIGNFPYKSDECKGCGQTLTIENAWMTDGCPCNSPLGINNDNETRWRLLMLLQQREHHQLAALRKRVEELESALVGLYSAVTALMEDSEGVSGLHKNGDIATWEDLTDGIYGCWLGPHFQLAREVLDKPRSPSTEQGGPG